MTTSTSAPAVAFIRDETTSKPLPHVGDLPSLAEVQQDLTILTGLPLPIIVDLRRQLSHLAADVDAVLYRILSEAGTKDQRSDAEPDRLLTPQAAAARFGVYEAVVPRPRRRDPGSPAASRGSWSEHRFDDTPACPYASPSGRSRRKERPDAPTVVEVPPAQCLGPVLRSHHDDAGR